MDGKRSGKGKEYNNDGEILFEGEYLDGNRWNGKGIEYNENYDFQFEWEYLNVKKWNGVIIEYDLDDNSIIFNGNIFEGENETELKDTLNQAIKLLEDDYLGGHGSRGYGQVKIHLMKPDGEAKTY